MRAAVHGRPSGATLSRGLLGVAAMLGVAVLLGASATASATEVEYYSLKHRAWKRAPTPPFTLQGMNGNSATGLVAYGGNGRQVVFISSLVRDNWEFTPEAPFQIAGISGNNRTGPVVFGAGNRVAYMNGSRDSSWKELPRAPFQIGDMFGAEGGPVIVDQSGSRMAYCRDYRRPQWNEMARVPFPARTASGKTDYYGAFAVSGRKVLKLPTHNKGQYTASWEHMGDAPFDAIDCTGDLKYGMAVLGANGQIATSPAGALNWTMHPPCGIRPVGITCSLAAGVIVWGEPVGAPAPPPKPTPPPAPVDRNPPVVSITNVQENPRAQASAVDVTVRVQDASPIASVTVNGRAANQAGRGTYTARVRLRGGRSQIIAEATDVHGNTGRATQQIVIDSDPPAVQFVNVQAGRLCRTQTYEVVVRITDASPITAVSINGQPATLRAGSDWAATIQLRPGDNQVVAQATDAQGNTGRAVANLFADWQPPTVEANAQILITINGRVDDPSSQVTVEGQPVQVRRDGSFVAQITPTGTAFVTVVATDAAGNQSTQKIRIR